MLLMALKVAPALVAGNTVVVKSAEEAPLAVLRICELMNRILPPGCFNMLSGFGPECGAPLVGHPLVRKVTFTGVGRDRARSSRRAAAEKLIPVTLELGGKSPMIVFADCDFDKTVSGALTSMRFTRQGQSCTAASRIYVERPIFDRFVAAMKDGGGRDGHGRPAGREDRYRHHRQRRPAGEGARLHRGRHEDRRRHGACLFRDADRPGAEEGPVHPARHLHRPRRRQPAGAGGDLRPGHRAWRPSTTPKRCSPRRTTANTAWPPRSGPTT